MKLTKKQRVELFAKFGGKCAYCGAELGNSFHADHLEPVLRLAKWVRGEGYVLTGDLERPERDTLENMMPSCAPCNIDKHSLDLERWRRKLQDGPNVLLRNNPTYRHSLRFKLIEETGNPVIFYFEQLGFS